VTEPQEPRGTASNHLTTDELSECAFSPETAAAGWLEHAEGCPACAAELADLRLLLTGLAELPEPELPESVGIRLDAAVARAWQEADADAEREAAAEARSAAGSRRTGRRSWRRLAVPLGSLALIAAVAVGVGALLHSSSPSHSASSSSGVSADAPSGNSAVAESSVAAWVQSTLAMNGAESATPAPGASGAGKVPRSSYAMGQAKGLQCASVPPRTGYTPLATSRREFDGVSATLIVYQNAKEPASNTVYAVVYAGSSCPGPESSVLAQGSVDR
jgi:hypothetical protein